MSEPVMLRRPTDLTLEAFEEIVWQRRRVRLHPTLLQDLATARASMLATLAAGGPVYGVTTGMGYLATVQLDEEEQRKHQSNLLMGRAVGGPPFLDRAEARAVLLARLASLLGGQVGVTPHLCAFLADRLNDDFVPAIPRQGIGCAGDIIALAHAFQTFLGVGCVLTDDGILQEAALALTERAIEPYEPALKEGIALIAGAPAALALAIARRRTAVILYRQLEVTAACAIDAIRAPLSPYEAAIAHLANDPLMGSVLARLDDLLLGSDGERHLTQAPVSFRVIPQVLTHLARTLGRFEEDIRRELTAVTDSPAYVENRFVTSGGFHAVALASHMDFLCIAWVQAAELMAQHIHRLLDHRFTELPDQLTPVPGPRAGLVVVHKRVVGALNELRRLAAPASIGSSDTSLGQEDVMTFTFEAAEKLHRVQTLVREVIACTLLVCRQAWWLRAIPPAGGLQTHVETLIATVPPVDQDRPLGGDVATLIEVLASGGFQ